MKTKIPPFLNQWLNHQLTNRIQNPEIRFGVQAGIEAQISISVAMLTWALVTGMAMIKSGIGFWMTLLLSCFAYSGTAQLAALPLILLGTNPWLIILTSLIINSRFIMFNAALVPYFRHLPIGKRLLTGYITVDMTVALIATFNERYEQIHKTPPSKPMTLGFIYGHTITSYLSWHFMSFLGIFLAYQLPNQVSLIFGATLALLTILIPLIKSLPSLITAISAGIFSLWWYHLPHRLGLPIAILAAALLGLISSYLLATYYKHKKGPSS